MTTSARLFGPTLLGMLAAGACAGGTRFARDTRPAPVTIIDVPGSSGAEDEPNTAKADAGDVPDPATPDEPNEIGGLDADGSAGILGLLQLDGGTGLGRFGTARDGGRGPVLDAGLPGQSLDPHVIQRVVRAHVASIRFCYEKALSKDPKLKARIAPRFVIGTDGRVTNVSLRSSSGNAELDRCVENALSRIVFPKPKNGVVVVTYPFVFSPSK